MTNAIPLRRVVQPSELAAAYVTGRTVISVSGGLAMS
jgi:hypothetical protein